MSFALSPMFAVSPASSPVEQVAQKIVTLSQAWQDGGPLMWVLAGLSIIALAVFFYLLLAQRSGAIAPRALVSDVFSQLAARNFTEARRLCIRRPCPFAALALAALDAERTTPQGVKPDVKTALETAGAHEAERLQGAVDWLSDLAALAPLVGLLGTVLGMYQAFSGVGSGAAIDAKFAQLTAGIDKAIITTVCGLVISIPCLAFHAFLRRRTARRIANLESLAVILEKAFV